jgi:hypothetical protein
MKPRKPSARVVMHRRRLDQVSLAVADGFLALAEAIVRQADPPDATPFGEGLVTRGGWLVYVGGKKAGGGSIDGRQPKTPRRIKVRRHGIVAMAGFGFPGRFQEDGTVHHDAQPFFGPALDQTAPRATEIMEPVVRPALKAIR